MQPETEKNELSSEELDAVSGGSLEDDKNARLATLNENCPKGDKHEWKKVPGADFYFCSKCSKPIAVEPIFEVILNGKDTR